MTSETEGMSIREVVARKLLDVEWEQWKRGLQVGDRDSVDQVIDVLLWEHLTDARREELLERADGAIEAMKEIRE